MDQKHLKQLEVLSLYDTVEDNFKLLELLENQKSDIIKENNKLVDKIQKLQKDLYDQDDDSFTVH
jgi:Na+/phosphate symporter